MHAQQPARSRRSPLRVVAARRPGRPLRLESHLRRPLGLGLGLALAWAIGAGQAAAAGSTPKLLLLPIVVHSAEDPAYLREGLSDMLKARLDRIGAIDIVMPDANASGTTQLGRARDAARKAGADYVLFGSFTRFGQGASLDVQCASADPSGPREPLREIFVHSGSIGDIIPDLDELAGKVSRFARGEAVVSSVPSTAPGVGVSVRDYQALLARVAALEKSLAALRAEAEAETPAAATAEADER
jgi:outer membrane protein insertion porin family